MFPPDIPKVRLPDPDVCTSSIPHVGDMDLLNKRLRTKKNIIISGAGVSTNAGSKSRFRSTVSDPSDRTQQSPTIEALPSPRNPAA